MFLTAVYFILAIFLLVVVHEYGHFQVARWCGVKVLRFSFGFGKVLARFRDKKGTEYVWSLFPLGGYVKMLGESTEPVSADEQHLAFNHKPLWARVAIVLAGPLFNFIFAAVALWLVAIIGTYSLAPLIESVTPGSIAAHAGVQGKQEIIGLNGIAVTSWRGFHYAIMPYIGSQDSISLTMKAIGDGRKSTKTIPLTQWQLDDKNPDPLKSLGLQPMLPSTPPVIGEIEPNSPAASTALQSNDRIVSANGNAILHWQVLVDYVRTHPNTAITLVIKRKGQLFTLPIQSSQRKMQGKMQGYLGIKPQKIDNPVQWIRLEREPWIPAMQSALRQTVTLTKTTFIFMGRLVSGQLSVKTLSGPLGIAQGAGSSGRNGLVSYLFFLAIVSIGLGALNLLPIPLLDGGHLLYYAIEFLIRRPVPESVKTFGATVGIVLLSALMCIALTNDLSRFLQ